MNRKMVAAAGVCLLASMMGIAAQTATEDDDAAALDPNCTYFGKKAHKANPAPAMSAAVVKRLGGDAATRAAVDGSTNTIDRHLFQAMAENGVQPVAQTTDYEFLRRVSFDLTGRPPTMEKVQSFAADSAKDKRAKLVEELLAKPEWLDKWTMWFGDLYKNCTANSQIRRFPSGVEAFNTWIRSQLAANTPYNRMASTLISTAGTDSYVKGELNWLVGGFVTGGPVQDIWDQQAANVAQTFLGVSSLNCLLCHNGRGHLDALSLWGSKQTRSQAWGMASYFSRTDTSRTPIDNDYYWNIQDNTRYRTNYALNTTTGNRPARQPVGSTTTVAPVYIFNGEGPAAGENFRTALARQVTGDFQFARATVNYFWKEFFGVGLVDPVDQFDPARLDPDNPPSDCAASTPCTLQPSNPRLLNALAQDFIDSGYSIKALMREIVNSQAYQLTARYEEATWDAAWDKYFARKFVRRLWAEEVHDAVAQTSGLGVSYNTGNTFGTINWAMQFPETKLMPSPRNPITSFLDAFLRGNRDDEPRRDDGSIAQSLNMMNDDFITTRARSSTANGLLAKNLSKADGELVNFLFLTVLNRPPDGAELSLALKNLSSGNRTQEAENLLWSLYNKVDFLFNY